MVLPPDINVGGMFYYRMIILMEIPTHRHLDVEETSDTSTNVSIIDLQCCNYYFRMFQDECYMKHDVHVPAGIFVSESQTTYLVFFLFFLCCTYIFLILHISYFDVVTEYSIEKFSSDVQTVASL